MIAGLSLEIEHFLIQHERLSGQFGKLYRKMAISSIYVDLDESTTPYN